ncbi:MAG: glycosyltransferase involved in cell wall biosynthesis [Polaribacter sp.]|jgi:glycosyltransferase involved in cell wall biosynthesis
MSYDFIPPAEYGYLITDFTPEDVVNKIQKALKFSKITKGRKRIAAMGIDSETIANKIIVVYKKALTRG